MNRNAFPIGNALRQSTQLGVVRIKHAEEAEGNLIRLDAHNGIAPREIDVVGHNAEIAHVVGRVDSTCGICGDKRLNAQLVHDPNGKRHLLSRVALVAMQAPLHGKHAFSAQLTAYEATHMTRAGGSLHEGNIRKGNENRLLDLLCQRTQTRT